MKPTTSLYFVIQQCQENYIFVFYVFYRNLKEKGRIRRNINSNYYFDLLKIRVGRAYATKIELPLPYS